MKKAGLTAAATLAFAFSSPVFASGAHEHGVAELAIAQEGAVLEVQFSSPAMNLVGFEHQARTEQERNKVELAKAQLGKADELFRLQGGSCALEEADVDVGELLARAQHEPDHAEHHGPDHDAHHESDHDDHHDQHADDSHHTEHDQHEVNHGDITAHYRWRCGQPEKITAIHIALFESFPAAEKIQVMWVGALGQGYATATASNAQIVLR